MASQNRRPNRLAQALSPYLLQHANNPVDWYPWGEEAFEKAHREDKPIFLSVGYSTCHWCHVMARESFSDPEVAHILNEHFVSIKVDREERPDVDEVYMRAVLIFTNGHGGWPMSVFLTSEGKPFFGGTYFPKEHFKALLLRIAQVWREERTKVEQVAEEVARAIQTELKLVQPVDWIAQASEELLQAAEEALLRSLDRVNGGFESAPKFPPHQALLFLLHRYQATRRLPLWEAVELTLRKMATGGLFDHIGGGFHRYSVDSLWLVPHFEKMLYDNAQLAQVYAWAYAISGDNFFRWVAEETYEFLLRDMQSPEGGFYSALDAESLLPDSQDSEKEEGAFYLWRPNEVKAVLGEAEGMLFCQIYGISDEPNFVNPHTGYSGCIPNLLRASIANWAKALHWDENQLWERIKEWRLKLRTAREQRPRPHCDDKVITSWNALAIRSFALGYQFLGEERYRCVAEQAAEFLWTHLRQPDGKLWHCYRSGVAQVDGMLDDYAFLLVALLDLYEATANPLWLERARLVAEQMVHQFWDDKEGGFWFVANSKDLFARSKPGLDGAEPSPNGMAAQGLVRLASLSGNTTYAQLAYRTIITFGGLLVRFPRGFLTLLSVLQKISPLRQEAAPSDQQPIRQLRVEPNKITLQSGEMATLRVHLQIADGWHLSASDPQTGSPALQASLESQLVAVEEVHLPTPTMRSFPFAEAPLATYEGFVTVCLKVRALEVSQTKEEIAVLRLRYQACDNQRCLAPAEQRLEVMICVVPLA